MSVLKNTLLTIALMSAGAATLSATPAFADEMKTAHSAAQKAAMMEKAPHGTFAKKTFKVAGQWSVETVNGQTILRLSDDFKTKNGPDLKIFLSPIKADQVTGQTATQGAINLGALQSNKGGSDYIIPAGVDLANFNSVLIHCEAYSKLWAAGSL